MPCTITAVEFKDLFDRDQFIYGNSIPDIRDKDIDEAISQAEIVFRDELYPTDMVCQKAKLFLTAHFLQLTIESSDGGGQSKLLQSSRSVGSISESVSIPVWMNEGEFAYYATTYYGQQYLIISKPYLDGAVFSVPGGTSF